MTTWFISGAIVLSLVVGVLVGASSSPVAGVVVTGLLGVAIAFSGRGSGDGKAPTTEQQDFIGQFILIFSVAMAVGIGMGVKVRVNDWFLSGDTESTVEFPWQQSESPSSVREAIDWLIIQEKLVQMGLSEQQVQSLYDMKLDSANVVHINAQDDLVDLFRGIEIDPPKEEHVIAEVEEIGR